jgi:site-specific recombinase XerD
MTHGRTVIFPLSDFMEVTMLTELFPSAYRRYTESLAAPWLIGFAEWLVTRGYSRKATRGHVLRLRQALERNGTQWLEQGLTRRQVDELFVFPTRLEHYRATGRNFLRYLISSGQGCLQSEPEFGRFTPVLIAYREYLLEVRGLGKETTRHHLDTVSAFLTHSLRPNSPISAISAHAVESYINACGQRMKRTTLQQPIIQLRCFLRFCYDRGEVPVRLDGIDTPRIYQDELPPRALPWNLTLAFLNSIDRSDAAGCRDHAILYLMAHFGLRPSEIALLNLDSIRWASRTLQVEQRKTRSSLVLPLSVPAFELLRNYVSNFRPASSLPSLFLRLRAPAQALTSTSVRSIYRRRARQSGLPLDKTSSYSLRHGFAMRLLERGVGIKIIGDLLGHRTVQSTQVYLRLQTECLREVGLPLPGISHDPGRSV